MPEYTVVARVSIVVTADTPKAALHRALDEEWPENVTMWGDPEDTWVEDSDGREVDVYA